MLSQNLCHMTLFCAFIYALIMCTFSIPTEAQAEERSLRWKRQYGGYSNYGYNNGGGYSNYGGGYGGGYNPRLTYDIDKLRIDQDKLQLDADRLRMDQDSNFG